MTITGYQLVSAVGTHSWNQGATYQSRYRVFSDDFNDGPQTILYYMRTNVPELQLGAQYTFAGDAANDGSFLQDISVDSYRATAYGKIWMLVANYAPQSSDRREPDDDKDESGQKTDDPLEWRWQINSGTNLYAETLYEAEYMGGFASSTETEFDLVDGSANPNLGTKMFPCNSAMVPYDPRLEIDRPTGWLTLKKNLAVYDAEQIEKFFTSTNHVDIRPKLPYRGWYNNAWKANELRFDTVDVSYRRRQRSQQATAEVEYMECQFQFSVRRATYGFGDFVNPVAGTWDEFVIDAGTLARAREGDDDGLGGTIQPILAGAVDVRRLLDSFAVPLGQQVHFDGAGKPLLHVTGSTSYSPVKVRWRKYQPQDFTTIPGVGDFFEAVPPP